MRYGITLLIFAAGCGGQATATETVPIAASTGSHGEPRRAEANSLVDVIAEVVASADRPEEERARDRYRNPVETLAFFGVGPGMHVVELSPGAGWYSRILVPLVGADGSLTVALPDGRYGEAFRELQAADPERFGDVRIARLAPPDGVDLGAPGSADVVLTFRNAHGWVRRGEHESVVAAAFEVLRPGGIFGIVQHRDAEGADPDPERGYLPESYVIEFVSAAGFEFVDRSEVNANPRDTRDHPDGVWSLPPGLRGGETDRERFVAIGESDRMTLKFRKPRSE